MKPLIAVVAAVVIIGGGYLLWQSSQTPMASNTSDTSLTGTDAGLDTDLGAGTDATTSGTDGSMSAGTPKTVTVTFNGDAFSPKTVTINKGDTVKFVSSGTNMWVAADEHPTHTEYSGTTRTAHCPDTSGTAFDQCAPGTSFNMTFQKTGSWDYHDHLNAQLEGTVIVK